MNNLLKGALLALALFFISLILVSFYLGDWGNPFDYLGKSYKSKRITLDALLASVPNALLFFFLINKNKLSRARGVQIVIICTLVFMMIIKFLA